MQVTVPLRWNGSSSVPVQLTGNANLLNAILLLILPPATDNVVGAILLDLKTKNATSKNA
jgi:hypothetical protein